MNRMFSYKSISRKNNFYFLSHEKKNLEEHYDFLKCEIKRFKGDRFLVVYGHYSQTGVNYEYEIKYDGFSSPVVKIISPQLIDNPPHVYDDRSLCLYFPKEQPWDSRKCTLYGHTVPWVHEWILYYEIYLITGVWEHPEAPHGSNSSSKTKD